MKRLYVAIVLSVSVVVGYSQSRIPECFFNHSHDEYVGVSYPTDDASIQKSSAIAVAALSYYVNWSDKVENVGSITNVDSDESMTMVSSEGNFNIKITNEFLNENGELFVSIKIETDTIDKDYISIYGKSASRLEIKGNSQKYNQLVELYGVMPNQDVFLFELNDNYIQEDDSIDHNLSLDINSNTRFVLQNFNIQHKTPLYCYNDSDSSGKTRLYFPCDESLHVAYVRCLLALVNEGNNYKLSINNNHLSVEFPEK